jgi:ribosome biogenesis GTPase / thiamine phosphate phosphatase
MSTRFPLKRSARSYAGQPMPPAREAGETAARVTVTHGQSVRARTAAGGEVQMRGTARTQRVVCGDRVRLRPDAAHGQWRLIATEPRSTVLCRSNARGDAEPLAANLSLLLVVLAPQPQPDLFIVDRYLSAARCEQLAAMVLVNKSDLSIDAGLQAEMTALDAAGYACQRVSAQHGTGLAALASLLSGHTAMLVGQSGTGKSSLVRALAGDLQIAIGSLARDDTGRHTTTATRLYALPQGGELVDSPGVRDFAPALTRLEPRTLGFVEIEQLAAHCRFTDCAHMREPDCAVRAAIGTRIGARRYESYRRLRRLHDRLCAGRVHPHSPRTYRTR